MAANLKFANQNRRSATGLLLAILVTALVTTVLLLGLILPVHFGVDPVGWGAKLGIIGKPDLTSTAVLANNLPSSTSSATSTPLQGNVAPANSTPQEDDPLSTRQETVELTIPPKQSLDYRLAMERDYELDYQWKTNGKKIDSELRGEANDGKAPGKTFAKLVGVAGKGFFIIPFNGQFGWHWQNKTDKEVKIRLTTKGHYQVVGQLPNPTLN